MHSKPSTRPSLPLSVRAVAKTRPLRLPSFAGGLVTAFASFTVILGLGAATADAKGPAGAGSLPAITEAAMPSVVNISTTKVRKAPQGPDLSPFHNDPFFKHFFGPGGEQRMPREQRRSGLGSGVIVREDGIVVTNNHVVEQADTISVKLSDGRELDAELVGADPKSDIAVLRLKGEPENLKALAFGNSAQLRLADTVLAIGNPFGVGQTVTMGIVSAKGRANVGIVDYEDFIQTDAAINPGNSGGALINTRGQLVGINTAIFSRSGGYQGIGFAIPSNMVKSIMTSLLEHGKVVRGWLGVMIQAIDADMAEALGLEDSNGVLVADVTKDGPAEKAGFKPGDVILSVNGRPSDTTGSLRNMIAGHGAGKRVRFEVLRGEETLTLKATLGELPLKFGGEEETEGSDNSLSGLVVARLNEETREKFEIDEEVTAGIVVTDVTPGSEAHRVGIGPGNVIVEADRQTLETPKQFAAIFEKAEGKVLLLVHHGDGTRFVILKKGED